MNRVVHAHLKRHYAREPEPDEPVFPGGSSRPNRQFQLLCDLAGVKPKQDVETGDEKLWVLKDLRKTAQPTTTNTCQNRRSKSSVTPSAA